MSLRDPLGAPMVPVRYRVVERRRETHDTVTLTSIPDAGVDAVEEPRPGQFHMLSAFGVGEVPISVSGIGPQGRIEHTVRAVGANTEALDALSAGDAVGVRGPFGRGWHLDGVEGMDVVVLAGGIGLAPLRPLIQNLVEQREESRSVRLLVGARRSEELCFSSDLAAWSDAPGIEVAVTVDSATRGWAGQVGVVTNLVEDLDVDAPRTVAFVCGPEVMMRFSARALIEFGLLPERIQLSAERNMKCAIAHCGHCQYGPLLICRDGPVFDYPELSELMEVREL